MNCSFNIRYKPRTTRQFTKSDLTVYDSAGNTALNALTVYGKSEVVDGAIVSAGEGYAVVRLADLNWSYSATRMAFDCQIADIIINNVSQLICGKYPFGGYISSASEVTSKPKGIYRQKDTKTIFVKDTDYTTVEDFVASLGDATLAYELADPTQGNTIAIKTGNGTGVNGTMATFSTGTPLRGIPETDVRDVMEWDGSVGTVTKKCGEVDLGTRIWTEYGSTAEYTRYVTGGIDDKAKDNGNCLCAKYNSKLPTQSIEPNMVWISNGNAKLSVTTNVNEYASASDFTAAMSGVKLIYELATPTVTSLTTAENASIAGLRTFEPQTHAQNNAQTEMTVDYTIRVPTI